MAVLRRLGTALIVVGLLGVVCGALWQVGLLPGSQLALPRPVVLERAVTPEAEPLTNDNPVRRAIRPAELAPRSSATQGPTGEVGSDTLPTSEPVATAVPTAGALPGGVVAADAADRREIANRPRGGYAVRLAIPAVSLDTPVQQAGIVYDNQGTPTWQTLPFVAVHYGDLTALVGGPGNAVIAGHVVTQREGNVFRSLYRVDIDTRIQVWDDKELEHDFRVVGVHLVPPGDTSPLNQTPDPTLTLITCGGTFDSRTREFSERLIVTAKPVEPE